MTLKSIYKKIKYTLSKKYYVKERPVSYDGKEWIDYGVRHIDHKYSYICSSDKKYIERQVEIRNSISTVFFLWLSRKVKKYLESHSSKMETTGWEGSIKTWAKPTYESMKKYRGNIAWFGVYYNSSHWYAFNKDYKHWKRVAFKLTCVHTFSVFLDDFIHVVIFDGASK